MEDLSRSSQFAFSFQVCDICILYYGVPALLYQALLDSVTTTVTDVFLTISRN